MIDDMKRKLVKVLALSPVTGCASAGPKGRSVTTLTFNYTERYIGDVVVDGAWTGGANAFGMGGGALGLLAPSDPTRAAVLKLEWIVSGRLDFKTNRYVELPIEKKSASVEVARPYPTNPSYLVLHFYPDGHVEAELETDSPKRRIPPPAGYRR